MKYSVETGDCTTGEVAAHGQGPAGAARSTGSEQETQILRHRMCGRSSGREPCHTHYVMVTDDTHQFKPYITYNILFISRLPTEEK